LINERGFVVDIALTLAARTVAREENAAINAQVSAADRRRDQEHRPIAKSPLSCATTDIQRKT